MSVSPVGSVGNIASGQAATGVNKPPSGSGNNVFANLIRGANDQQLAADQAVENLAAGGEESLHNVVLSAAKADLSFRLVLEMRNKLIESYQEIMRMQV